MGSSRPTPFPVSHKTFLRVNIHRQALNLLNVKAGDLCRISVAINPDESISEPKTKTIPVIAWLAADAHLQKHIALISENVRGALGIGFENKVTVGKYTAKVEYAATVVVKEVEIEEIVAPVPGKNGAAVAAAVMGTKLKVGIEKEQKEGWRWFLEHIFGTWRRIKKDGIAKYTLYSSKGQEIVLRVISWIVETKYISEGLVFNSIEYKGRKRAFRVEKIIPQDAVPSGSERTINIQAYKVTESTTVEIIQDELAPGAVPKTKSSSVAKITHSPQESSVILATPSRITFASIGGLSKQVATLRTLLLSTLHQSHHFTRFGLTPPRGILLFGPPGTGKTLLLKAIASEIDAKCFVLNGTVVGKYMGESEAAVRKVFAEARKNQPAIIFVDEVDSLAPKRGAGDGSEGRVVATLLTEMDGMDYVSEDGSPVKVVVVAATNRPNAIDEALRRPGRLDREIEIGIPDVNSRNEILALLMRELPFEGVEGREKGEFVKALAGRTHGFVGADLESLVRTGFTIGLKRLGVSESRKGVEDSNVQTQGKQEVVLREEDIEAALKDVRPTAMREIFLEPPKVRWSDIGGQEEVKQRLREAVEWPLTVCLILTLLNH